MITGPGCLTGLHGVHRSVTDQLIKWRNVLAHYREKREPWELQPVPSFLGQLGLTITQAERSVKCVKAIVTRLSDQLKINLDYGWDSKDGGHYFALRFHSEPQPKKDKKK